MKNTINQLYYGEICPCKAPSPDSRRYRETSAHIRELVTEISDKYLDIKDSLEEIIESQHIITALESEADFARGLQLGILLMIDVMRLDK